MNAMLFSNETGYVSLLYDAVLVNSVVGVTRHVQGLDNFNMERYYPWHDAEFAPYSDDDRASDNRCSPRCRARGSEALNNRPTVHIGPAGRHYLSLEVLRTIKR